MAQAIDVAEQGQEHEQQHEQQQQKRKGNPFLSIFILLEVLLVLVVVGTPVAYGYLHADHIYPGVRALGIELGGMTQSEARRALTKPISDREGQVLVLRYGDRQWKASAAELGLRYDLEATVASAFALGRGQGFLTDSRNRLDLFRQGALGEAVVSTDRVRALDYMNRLAREIDANTQNAAIKIENLQVVTTDAKTGYRLDTEASAARVIQSLAGEQSGDVQLSVTSLPPQVTDQGLAEAKAMVQKLISAPVVITFSGRDWTLNGGVAAIKNVDRSWTIERAQLVGAVIFEQHKVGEQVVLSARFDPERFTAQLTSIAKELNRKPQDARFTYDAKSNRLTPIQVSQDGQTVDVTESVKRLVTAANSDNRTMQLAVAITKPALAVDQADSMGIREQVSQGVTTFAGSSAARAHNIQLAASKVDNAIIPPGATFSLLATLGAITADAGYEEGFAIVGDSTVTDVGGGVCQVATTVFRAAFYGGLPIVERNPHRYIVSRYFLKGGPHGLDAAIYDPGLDFKFKNNTGHYLVIKTDASDPANFTVTLYGTNPGWTVTMQDPVIKPGKEPGPRMADVQDATKPVGYKVLAQSAIAGESVSITRVVKQGNTVLSTDAFNTNYQPASEQWIVGTKK